MIADARGTTTSLIIHHNDPEMAVTGFQSRSTAQPQREEKTVECITETERVGKMYRQSGLKTGTGQK